MRNFYIVYHEYPLNKEILHSLSTQLSFKECVYLSEHDLDTYILSSGYDFINELKQDCYQIIDSLPEDKAHSNLYMCKIKARSYSDQVLNQL